jgi:hypothetical protein
MQVVAVVVLLAQAHAHQVVQVEVDQAVHLR